MQTLSERRTITIVRMNDKYDWDTCEDANILRRYQEITKDPERLRKAQSCIKDTVTDLNKSLGIPTPPPVPGRRNPATIMPLSEKYTK